MSEVHGIVREIGIDAGHRVPLHGSKCKNPHGHRYLIEAHCTGPLQAESEQEGMVIDFGFVKEEMMEVIDEFCDHGQILQVTDPYVKRFAPKIDLREAKQQVKTAGYYSYKGCLADAEELPVKLYLVPFAPTAENLARHWFQRLAPRVEERSNGLGRLARIVVHETPNCRAYYPL
jgi:6-pyruvoyltetrahydropterin/6-carboxytetrahydropterin synthase